MRECCSTGETLLFEMKEVELSVSSPKTMNWIPSLEGLVSGMPNLWAHAVRSDEDRGTFADLISNVTLLRTLIMASLPVIRRTILC